MLVAGAWAVGDNIGTRRAYLAGLEERAERLEREQTVVSQRAALAERARIARELHDVVAHHVSAIAVPAAAAEELAERDPSRARAVLATIQATSREALAEMRAVVGVLREEGDGVTLAPQPGLGQLAAQSRSAGLDVRVRLDDGDPPARILILTTFTWTSTCTTLSSPGPPASSSRTSHPPSSPPPSAPSPRATPCSRRR